MRGLSGIKKRVITGIVVVVPLWATFLLIRAFFDAIDGLLGPYLKPLIEYYLPGIHTIPGLGILAALIVLYLIGLVTTNIVGRQVVHRLDLLLKRIPLVKTIYGATKQITEAFTAPTRTVFKRVVFVAPFSPGTHVIGFVTNTVQDDCGRELPVVFIPSTPNPTTGFTLIMPPERVIETAMTVEEGMKWVLSGGILQARMPAFQSLAREGQDRLLATLKP